MAGDETVLGAILDELRAIHALLRRIEERQEGAGGEQAATKRVLAERLERAHRVKPAERDPHGS